MEVDFKGLIFDLEGVLCHTGIYHRKAWAETMKKHRIPFLERTLDLLQDLDEMEFLEKLLSEAGVDVKEKDKKDILEDKREFYKSFLSDISKEALDKDALSILGKLKELGYSLAVGSSSTDARLILERLGISGYFNAVCDSTTLGEDEPTPEIFRMVANELYLEPKECLVVEEDEEGIAAAIKAGFFTAGIGRAAKCSETDYMLDDLTDLMLFL